MQNPFVRGTFVLARAFLDLIRRGCVGVVLAGLLSGAQAQNGLVISEFLALSSQGLKDDFGESSDFVELFNGSPQTVNLEGYFLTDDLNQKTQWRFPATNLVSGSHLLIWASSRDRTIPGAALHTNFRLNANGEALALVQPDGLTVVHEYTFGIQVTDRSFGLEVERLGQTTLLAQGALAKFFAPTNNSLSNKWTAEEFNDAAWNSGTTGLGFDTNPESLLRPYIGTSVQSQMFDANPKRVALYVRIPFIISDPSNITNPGFQIRFDDGFIAYLNGREIMRRGLSSTAFPAYNTPANAGRENTVAVVPERANTLLLRQLLRPGPNLLAIHGLNRSATDSDFLLVPEILSQQVRYVAGSSRYFASPTPGIPNAVGVEGSSGAVEFTQASQQFFTAFDLEIHPREPNPLAQIRYTVNGTIPTTNSPLYPGMLRVTNSIQIRARIFEPNFLPGPVHTESYLRLAPIMQTVSSDLPLIAIHSFGAAGFDSANKRPCFLFVHEPKRGRASFTNAPDMIFRAGLKLRGSSTEGNAKHNWAVDSWGEDDRDQAIPLLGMPTSAEWVFHAPFQYDPALIRNPLASDMSNEIGSYASRYRFAEIYLNTARITNSAATLNTNNYFGLYNIIERISISPDRVNIDVLTDNDLKEPEVTGGYLLSVDREFGGAQGFSAGGQSFNYIEPKFEELGLPQRAPQREYLTQYMTTFGRALSSASFTNVQTGYLPHIDRPAWIDHHIVNEISLNADALRLSTYLHKKRNGPIVYGPVWDFDRAFGSTDGRDSNPLAWDSGTGFFTQAWWERVFRDPNFWQAYIDRFQELMEGAFSTPNLHALIDQLNDQVKESAPRDFAKWRQEKRGGSQAGEIAYSKDWIRRRMNFIRTNFLAKPVVSLPAGQIDSGAQLQLTGPSGATIYYTLDGSDPREVHGGISAQAKVYASPLFLTGETRLVARSRNLAHRNMTGSGNPPITSPWSGPTQARYALEALPQPGDLMITELNYNPAPPTPAESAALAGVSASDFEFVEIQNISGKTLDLFGCRFVSGIDFNFANAALYTLRPGEFAVVAKNLSALRVRYENPLVIAGQYNGSLNDGGDTLRLVEKSGQLLIDLIYQDDWHAATDGFGFTIVKRTTSTQTNARDEWRPSASPLGSPGQLDFEPAVAPEVVVNEVLANSDSPFRDVIELKNLRISTVDLSGWFISDDRTRPFKYRIPSGTILASGEHWTVDESEFNAPAQGDNAFQLRSTGDEVWLFAASASGSLLGYSHGFAFGASDPGITIGRHVLSTGEERFVAQSAATLGRANADPKVGPVVIREVHYHPVAVLANGKFWSNTEDEYIEILGVSQDAIPGTNPAPWRVRGSVDFDFPVSFKLAGDESAIVVSFDPGLHPARAAEFRLRFGIPGSVALLGPFRGGLNNDNGIVRLLRPGIKDPNSDQVPYIVVDELRYQDHQPWPEAADGAGPALARRRVLQFGDDSANWQAQLPSPGSTPAQGPAPVIARSPVNATVVGGTQARLDLDVESTTPVRYQWRHDGELLEGATDRILILDPVRLADAGDYDVLVMNSQAVVVSGKATLTVLRPATVITQPESQNLRPGSNVVFRVEAIGQGTLRYQWKFKGFPIPGAGLATLALTNVQLADSGPYTVTVTDSIGSSTSDPAQLNVLVRPSFDVHPPSLIALAGDDIQLGVSLSGLRPMAFRWRKGSANIPGATNSILRFSKAHVTNSGIYAVVVTNLASGAGGVTSLAGNVIVMSDFDQDGAGDAWEVSWGYSTNNAADASLDDDADGQNNAAEFRAGTDPKNSGSVLRIDSIVRSTNGTEITFKLQTNSSYSVQFKESLDRGIWQSLVDSIGRTSSIPTTILDLLPSSASRFYRLITPPRYAESQTRIPWLLFSPVSQTVDAGESATFEVQIDAEGRVAYQWMRDGVELPSATASQLELINAQPKDEGLYTVVIRGEEGVVVTQPARFTVLQRPQIVQQPQAQALNTGSSLILSVSATGSGSLLYQWLKDGKPLPRATASTLEIPSVTPEDAGYYQVSVGMESSNGVQRRRSEAVLVRVNE